MKAKETIKVDLIETDTLDSDNSYYLYEVTTTHSHYYYCTSDNEKVEDKFDFSNQTELIERQDMTDKDWHIAKALFQFLWESSNGTNTCMDFDQLNDEGISKDDVEEFWDKFSVLKDCLDMYEDDGVEIYWQFLCSFDLTTCDFFA